MSKAIIEKYYNNLSKLKQISGSDNELSSKKAFAFLLQSYCNKKELVLVEEIPYKNLKIRPDGTIRTFMHLDWGFWESKDIKDNFDEEIEKKISIGYPTSNIIFENSEIAVLIQNNQEIMRINLSNAKQLDIMLTAFVNYEPQEYKDFNKAIQKFKEDVPAITQTLRKLIDEENIKNDNFNKKFSSFWETCKQCINQEITTYDIREMIIQHILTADIFDKIFGDNQFHKENNIASQLQEIINTFWTRQLKLSLLSQINHYYDLIRSKASQISDHHEKQKFLKAVYENFYKSYNPKGADKLGIIYTPNEIVKFMIESTDVLLEKYFNKSLSDKNVEILDPATGTGTFICDIIEYIPPHKLSYKYKNEIHANEVSILPYYIANLNIEYTYLQKLNQFEQFDNLCFVDTLDNMGFSYEGKQTNLFGLSIENLHRIKNQNEKKISVVIGNPPYNANQQNENENNKNKVYYEIDKRIEQTYAYKSKSQKTKVYDMYTRFFRWASDRIDNQGMVCFITNNSFLTGKGFDSFRRCLTKEYNAIYIIDLNGNIRAKSNNELKISNVFNIQVGVCITFLIRKKKTNDEDNSCRIFYYSVPEGFSRDEKLFWLLENNIEEIPFEKIRPDKNDYWLNLANTDFDNLLPIAKNNNEDSIFDFFTHGISTNRDDWVYDFNEKNLIKKVKYFISEYNKEVDRWKKYKEENNYTDIKDESNRVVDNFVHEFNYIKWSKMLKRDKLRKGKKGHFLKEDLHVAFYRPFIKKKFYFGYITTDVGIKFKEIFPNNNTNNLVICINGSSKSFWALMSNHVVDLHFTGDSFCFPLYKYDENLNKKDNISDITLLKYQKYYNDNLITKIDIFYYIYAVLHNPNYLKKYDNDLKKAFPRIPYYNDFHNWVEYGKKLSDLHINYENAESYPLQYEEDLNIPNIHKVKLKLDKNKNIIFIDNNSKLVNIPPLAYNYLLGNRNAIEWILDQFKEKEPNDEIIANNFNSYSFNDYKEVLIDLLKRICTVSIKTSDIIKNLKDMN